MSQQDNNNGDVKDSVTNIREAAARYMERMRELQNADPETPGKCLQCGGSIRLKDNFCSNCGARNTWRERYYWAVCGNCGAKVPDEDKYCRICGTLVGFGRVSPKSMAVASRLYGPKPTLRRHVCQNCGHQWTTSLMVDKEAYCPNCGGPAPIVAPGGSGQRE